MTHDEYSSVDTEAATLLYLESGIAVILLGSAEERIITFTPRRIASLNEALDELAQDRPAGLVIAGPHPRMFSVGLDAAYIASLCSLEDARHLVREGQRAVERIANMPFPTVAAVSGACLGAGCELALACDWRLMSDLESSLMGFPERKLGLAPALGGSQRLPALVGFPAALELLFNGRSLTAKEALRLGLVHQVVSYEKLLDQAEDFACAKARTKSARRLSLFKRLYTHTRPGRRWIAKRAAQQVYGAAPGMRPVVNAMLEAMLIGFDSGHSAGLLFEAQQFTALALRPETKALVKLFFASESTRSLGRAARDEAYQLQAAVIGAGVTGTAVAELLARAGCPVILKDVSQEALRRAVQRVQRLLKRRAHMSETERSFVLNRIDAAGRETGAIGNAQLAVEALPEDLALKQQLLREIEPQLSEDAVIATSSGSLSIAELSTALQRPERLLGLHLFPLENSQLVEIVRGSKTSNRAVALAAALSSRLGRFPIVVQDTPGFLVNRLLFAYAVEAVHLVAEGHRPEHVEAAAAEFGMSMGPLRLIDETGIRALVVWGKTLSAAFGERFHIPPLMEALAEANRFGREQGAGFYQYHGEEEQLVGDLSPFGGIDRRHGELADQDMILDRLLLSFVNESVRCLDEGVAGTPGPEAAKQINLASIFGIGFPAYRGGILEYADSRGSRMLYELSQALGAHAGPRLAPAGGLKCRAQHETSFQLACPPDA